jgi:hypothetical protein
VVDASSGGAISAVQVFVEVESRGVALRSITDTKGSFCFQELEAGTYRILAKRTGYRDRMAAEGESSAASRMDVSAGKTIGVTLRMKRALSLSGVVVEQSGRAREGAVVTLYRSFPPDGSMGPDDPRYETADSAGRFRFHGLAPGAYHLSAVGDPLILDDFEGSFAKEEQVAQTFYPSSKDVSGARAIPVGEGQDVEGIVITMATVALRTVSGRVVGAGPGPILMTLKFRAPTGGGGEIVVKVNEDGTFSKSAVPAGEYNLHIAPKIDRRIDLREGDVRDLTIDMR